MERACGIGNSKCRAYGHGGKTNEQPLRRATPIVAAIWKSWFPNCPCAPSGNVTNFVSLKRDRNLRAIGEIMGSCASLATNRLKAEGVLLSSCGASIGRLTPRKRGGRGPCVRGRAG